MGLADAPRDVAPGQVVGGKWRVVRLVGRGGMGAVYEGQNTAIGKRVALKFIDPVYAQNPDIVSRFQREAEAASVVESAHIVHVFDSGATEQGIPYIVMELLQGEDLRSRIKRQGKLPPGEAVHIAVQMLRGLHRAHAAGIVHRDLKPDNVFLVDRDDDPLFTKIVDFGISKMTRRPGGENVGTLTRQGIVLGTPYYMSPEQAQAVADLDGRTDLWSTGAILFECLAGRPPFQGDAYEAIIVAVCTTDAPDVRAFNVDVSDRLAPVVKRALTRDRERRFASAKEMLDALEATGLARSSQHGRALSGPSNVDAPGGARQDDVAAAAEARTRVSWTHSDGRAGARSSWVAEPGTFVARHRVLVGVGLGLMIATFAGTFAWLRLARVGAEEPRVVARSTAVAPVASAATVSPDPRAGPTATSSAASPEPRATDQVATPGQNAEPRHPAPVKKRNPTPLPASAPSPTMASPAPSPKPGVAGGLQIKTTYP